MVEAGADLAGVTQLAVVVVQAEQQRAETGAGTLRLGIADDDEFLPVAAFDLHPAATASRGVGAASALADQPFEFHLAGAFQNAVRLLGEVLGEAQQLAVTALQHLAQRCAALLQRHLAQVHAVQVRHVEQVIENAAAAPRLESVLQGLEVRRALLVRHHHLAIQPPGLEPESRKRRGLLGHLRRPVVAVAGKQPDLAGVDAREHPVAVELDFVPPVPARYRIDQGGQLRFEMLR